MSLSDEFTALQQGVPRKKKKAPTSSPGLTGADLVLAKAKREEDAAFGRASTAAGESMRLGIESLGNGSYRGSPAAMRAFGRNLAANHEQDQAYMDVDNIETERKAKLAKALKQRKKP